MRLDIPLSYVKNAICSFVLLQPGMKEPARLLRPIRLLPIWTELFHDSIIVTAILDRLLHHSTVINIKENSYRLKGKMEKGEWAAPIKV